MNKNILLLTLIINTTYCISTLDIITQDAPQPALGANDEGIEEDILVAPLRMIHAPYELTVRFTSGNIGESHSALYAHNLINMLSRLKNRYPQASIQIDDAINVFTPYINVNPQDNNVITKAKLTIDDSYNNYFGSLYNRILNYFKRS